MSDKSYLEPIKFKHAQLGECQIFKDAVGLGGLYISVAGKRLAKLIEHAEVSSRMVPFSEVKSHIAKVYETKTKGTLGGLPIEAYWNEFRNTIGGGYYGKLSVKITVDSVPVVVRMFPSSEGIGYEVKPQFPAEPIAGMKESGATAQSIKDVEQKLEMAMPSKDIGFEKLAAELFAQNPQ